MKNKDWNIFDIYPDMDLDGDHDLIDFLLYEDMINTAEKQNEQYDVIDFENDEDEIYFEYGIDRKDFVTQYEYLEAIEEAKYDWRDKVEVDIEIGLDPCDYETEEEYLEALNTSGKVKYHGIAVRKNQAKEKLNDYAQGYTCGIDVQRCKFIINDKSTAACYLTADGLYLYAQAIKEHFKLPFEIPDEIASVETRFDTLLRDLAEHNVTQALHIWEWCLDTFMPYIQYDEYKNDLTHTILIDIDSFVDEFSNRIVDYMVERPVFIEKLILQCTDSIWGIDDFVTIAIKGGHIKTAKRIMECAFNNQHTTVADKVRFIESCINECSDWEELETMETFKQHIFPIVFTQSDVRIKNKISKWQKEMSEYIAKVEKSSELYKYSRSNAWREKYKDSDVSPVGYDSENEYIQAVEARKYRWRKYCSIRYGINPDNYETREEYDAALKTEIEKQQSFQQKEQDAQLNDTTLYKFCKVSINYPEKPHYYYLTEKLKLKVGDQVKVPFGQNNEIINATVMAVGECYGSSFPCPISSLKIVKERCNQI